MSIHTTFLLMNAIEKTLHSVPRRRLELPQSKALLEPESSASTIPPPGHILL